MNLQDVGPNRSRLIEGARIAGFEQHKTATAIPFVPTSQKRHALRRLSQAAEKSIRGLSQGPGQHSPRRHEFHRILLHTAVSPGVRSGLPDQTSIDQVLQRTASEFCAPAEILV